MIDHYQDSCQPRFRDLIPWADPYIAGLMEKLRRSERRWHLMNDAPPSFDPELPDVDPSVDPAPWTERRRWSC